MRGEKILCTIPCHCWNTKLLHTCIFQYMFSTPILFRQNFIFQICLAFLEFNSLNRDVACYLQIHCSMQLVNPACLDVPDSSCICWNTYRHSKSNASRKHQFTCIKIIRAASMHVAVFRSIYPPCMHLQKNTYQSEQKSSNPLETNISRHTAHFAQILSLKVKNWVLRLESKWF